MADNRTERENLPEGAPALQNLEGMTERQASIVKTYDLNLAVPADREAFNRLEQEAIASGIQPTQEIKVGNVSRVAEMAAKGQLGNKVLLESPQPQQIKGTKK